MKLKKKKEIEEIKYEYEMEGEDIIEKNNL